MEISWRPFWKAGAVVFSDAGAFIVTLNGALPLALVGWLLIGASRNGPFFTRQEVWRWRWRFLALMLLLSGVVYIWLPKVEVVLVEY